MNEKILIDALEDIAQGTVDKYPPFRHAPKDALMQWAKDALNLYRINKDEKEQERQKDITASFKWIMQDGYILIEKNYLIEALEKAKLLVISEDGLKVLSQTQDLIRDIGNV